MSGNRLLELAIHEDSNGLSLVILRSFAKMSATHEVRNLRFWDEASLYSSEFSQGPQRFCEFGRFRLKFVTQHSFYGTEHFARSDGFRDITVHP